MKKILILLTSLLLLSSCFWSGDSESEGLETFSNDAFSISVPGSWQVVPKTNLPSPKIGDIVLAYSSTELRDDYKNNIVIIAEENSSGEKSLDLVKSLPSYLDETLQVFHRKGSNNLEFSDGETLAVIEFQGKYNNTTPLVTYLQTARSCGDTAYFLTISVAEQLDSYDRYAYLLSTFECN